LEIRPLRSKKELQSLIGKINFLQRFIANSTAKVKDFLPMLRVKDQKEFGCLFVLCKFDIVKHLLTWPVLQGCLMKWAIKLNSYALTYIACSS